ncbi:M23 family metallopeptidase [Luteimonas dalianensis]|uniref:M23 family metallopeptidase n=1 Tax=Luteimonas dalianensis TaxID=1148196 RepID=UPI003BF08F5C
MRTLLMTAVLAAAAGACAAHAQAHAQASRPASGEQPPAAADARIVFPASVQQGAMVLGRVPPGSAVEYDGRSLRVTGYGSVVFGVGRDASGPARVLVTRPDGGTQAVEIAVTARDWPLQRVDGVPPATVDPPAALAERIRREQALVTAARVDDRPLTGFAQHFEQPVQGRISGRFGRARVYNGKPGSPHSGMDIAAPQGTAIRAPADGVITLAEPDLYITGGTVLIDHGHGIGSNFLHMSRLDVAVGDAVRQGQVIGAVGSTGRSTGPHLHWGMTWFGTRIDPQLVLERPR